MAQDIENVVVTGFGPFHSHHVNVSWEVAKELTQMGFESRGINIIAREIPVVYETVRRDVPRIWQEYSPKLVVHMGLSNLSRVVCLESVAYKCGYRQPDNEGNIPPGGACEGTQNAICSQFDLVRLMYRIRKLQNMKVCIALSSDAGRYVCEFTYYQSLNINNQRTVFIHLPNINMPYTVREMAECVKYIILFLLEDLDNQEAPVWMFN